MGGLNVRPRKIEIRETGEGFGRFWVADLKEQRAPGGLFHHFSVIGTADTREEIIDKVDQWRTESFDVPAEFTDGTPVPVRLPQSMRALLSHARLTILALRDDLREAGKWGETQQVELVEAGLDEIAVAMGEKPVER